MPLNLKDVIDKYSHIIEILSDTCIVKFAKVCHETREACTFSLKQRADLAFHKHLDKTRSMLECFTKDTRRMPPLLPPGGTCAVATCDNKRIVRVHVLEQNTRQVVSSVYCAEHTIMHKCNYFENCAANWISNE